MLLYKNVMYVEWKLSNSNEGISHETNRNRDLFVTKKNKKKRRGRKSLKNWCNNKNKTNIKKEWRLFLLFGNVCLVGFLGELLVLVRLKVASQWLEQVVQLLLHAVFQVTRMNFLFDKIKTFYSIIIFTSINLNSSDYFTSFLNASSKSW